MPWLDGRWPALPLLGGAALARSPWVVLPCLLALLPCGWLAAAAARAPAPLLQLGDEPAGLAGPWEVAAVVAREPEPGRDGARLWLDVEQVRVGGAWRPLAGRVEVALPRAPQAGAGVVAGARVEAFLALRQDRPLRNPGAPYRDRLAGRGVAARAALKSPEQLRLRRPAGRAQAAPAHLRAALRRAIEARFEGTTRALALALLLGERGFIDDALATRMAGAGLAHVLSVSGLHVGLLSGLMLAAVRLLGGSPRQAAAAGAGAAVVMALLVVPRPPVQRAAVMALAVLGGRAADRRVAPLDALLLSVMALTWWQPDVVIDTGFRLTVAATAGLLLLTPPATGSWRSRLRGAVAAPLAAQAAVAPLVAVQSGALPLAGAALNVAAVPLLGLAMPLLVGTLALHAAGATAAAGAAARASDASLAALVGLAGLASGVSWATVALPAISLPLALAWWAALAGLRRHRAAALPLALVAALAMRAPRPPVPRLVALDVGQGDALLLQSRGEALLVDAGGYPGLDWSTGTHVVAPALHRLGIRALSAVSVSHAHADHAGGVAGVLGALPVRQLWLGATPPDSALQADVMDAARRSGSVALTPRAPVAIGDCRIDTLLPDAATLRHATLEVDNDASLVHLARCGRHVVLLPGDAGGHPERAWAQHAPAGVILKVGHHGSRTASSEAMLDALRPALAVISVGAGNRFGLPADEVVARLRRRAVPVYRTDRDGALLIELGERRRVRGLRWSQGNGDGITPR